MFGMRTKRVFSGSTPQLQRAAASQAFRSFSKTIGILARSTKVLVRTFSFMAERSTFSKSLRVVKSARPMPSALPCDASLTSPTIRYFTLGLSGSSTPRMRKRPITLVSMPVPLKFLPSSSTKSTSMSETGSLGIEPRRLLQQLRLASGDVLGGMASMIAVSS